MVSFFSLRSAGFWLRRSFRCAARSGKWIRFVVSARPSATAESSDSSFGDKTCCTALLWISCPSERIVIELEGNVHDTEAQRGYDQARTGFLKGAGYRVIRVRNRDGSREHLEAALREALGTNR